MMLILLFAIVGILILSFFAPVSEFTQLIYIALLFFLYCAIIIRRYSKASVIIISALVLRIAVMLIDYYDIFYIPFAGIDAIRFDNWAMINAENGNSELKLTNYTTILTFIYTLLGHSKLIAQFLNVILGTGILLILYDIFQETGEEKNRKKALLITAFFPTLVIFSAVLLREVWCQFFITLSLLYFLRWMRSDKIPMFIYSVLSVLLAAWMHSGCLFVAIGYFVAIAFYQPRKNVNKFSFGNVFLFSIIILGMLFILSSTDMFTDKLDKFDNDTFQSEGLYTKEFSAGSAYLQWINPNNPIQLLLFAPLKMIYFMFSTFPWDWRKLFDIISFVLDGFFYFLFLCVTFRRYRMILDILVKNRIKYIFISLLFVWFVFSYGTSNSGTAIRHRAKLYPLIITIFIFSNHKNKNEKSLILDVNNQKQ